jgi:flagellar biogenesis protein FliO
MALALPARMRTTRVSGPTAELGRFPARFPGRKLAFGFLLLVAAAGVFALVDRVAPAPPATTRPAAVEAAPPEQPAAAKTATTAPARKLLTSESPFSAAPLLAMGGLLAGAIALIFVLKRVLRGSRHVPGSKKILKVRDVLAIGPKRAIYLIGLEHRNLVVGLSGDQLSLLSEYSDEAEAEVAESAPPALEGRTGEFTIAAVRTASEAPAVQAPPAPMSLDTVVGGEVTVPPPKTAAREATAAAAPRSFPFAALQAHKSSQKPRTDRVPHKFRQLLEQAAEAEGKTR